MNKININTDDIKVRRRQRRKVEGSNVKGTREEQYMIREVGKVISRKTVIPERVNHLIKPIQKTKGFFKCKKCGSDNTEVYEISSSSIDEGSFQQIVCRDCGTKTASR